MTSIIVLLSSPELVEGLVRFIFGLAIGSFLNVVAFRFSPRKSTLSLSKGRSKCRSCRRQLRWFELIPLISFIIQGGRCRRCRKPLSWQYPVVELLSGLAAAFLSPFWFFVALAMVLLSVIDWRLMIIPDELNIFLALMGVLAGVWGLGSFLDNYAAVVPGPGNQFLGRLLAAVLGLVLLGLIVFVSRGRAMGAGDVKLAGALGLLAGWPDTVLVLALSFIVGGIWSASLLITGNGKMKTLVPFGPFLVIGFWLTYLFGHSILGWYFSLI